ncbi:hypothetical protein [Acanthamoeba castellanii mimivirus]|nr:hypothetical protein MIMI_L685 [Acanthamoeba polyphaga mimivirus]AHA45151.1 hypothetical protein HIRU_S245 [Hirudovirus strain Sangsue]AKI81362.1 hypothetical protein [Acanthamoeba polyphaga mimivirus]BAV61814.1 hypothetical protein [Acanthamoeba castellanii mimivirus]BAV62800.1 hypothetical protein [Acanthamoeba castellanii mimivirus]
MTISNDNKIVLSIPMLSTLSLNCLVKITGSISQSKQLLVENNLLLSNFEIIYNNLVSIKRQIIYKDIFDKMFSYKLRKHPISLNSFYKDNIFYLKGMYLANLFSDKVSKNINSKCIFGMNSISDIIINMRTQKITHRNPKVLCKKINKLNKYTVDEVVEKGEIFEQSVNYIIIKDKYHPEFFVKIKFETNYIYDFFDIECLEYSCNIGDKDLKVIPKITNPNLSVGKVIDNCRNKKFRILSIGKPIIKHDCTNIIVDENGYVSGSMKNCIDRYSCYGNYILRKYRKLINDGWQCLNEVCDNPVCILAQEDFAEKMYKLRKSYDESVPQLEEVNE